MSENNNIDNNIKFQEWIVFFAVVCNLVIAITLLIKNFSILGIVAVLMVEVAIILGFEKDDINNVPFGCKLICFFMADTLMLYFFHIKKIWQVLSVYFGEGDWKNKLSLSAIGLVVFFVGLYLLVFFGKLIGFAIYGFIVAGFIFGMHGSFWMQINGWKFLLLYTAVTCIFLVLNNLSERLSAFDQMIYKKKKKNWIFFNILYAVLTIIAAVYCKENPDVMQWEALSKWFSQFYSRWILFPVMWTGMGIALYGFSRLKELSKLRNERKENDAEQYAEQRMVSFDIYVVTGITFGYILIGFLFRHYTSWSFLFLIVYLKKFMGKIGRQLDFDTVYSAVFNLFIVFFNTIIFQLMLEQGLVINLLITIWGELKIRKQVRNFFEQKRVNLEVVLSGTYGIRLTDNLPAKKTWMTLIIFIALECVGWLSVRFCSETTAARLTGFGFPESGYIVSLCIMLASVIFSLCILFLKNPMNVHASVWEVGSVCFVFMLGCIVLGNKGGCDVSYRINDASLELFVAMRTKNTVMEQMDYVVKNNLLTIGHNELTVSVPPSSFKKTEQKEYQGKYENYEYTIEKNDGSFFQEKIMVCITDSDGVATITTFWYPYILMNFFNAE